MVSKPVKSVAPVASSASTERTEPTEPTSMAQSPTCARRREAVAPLFAYCADHCMAPLRLARRASVRAGEPGMTKLRLSRIKLGRTATPDWFIEGMCREIGQPVEVVMGQEWAQRHLPAPVPAPTTERKAS